MAQIPGKIVKAGSSPHTRGARVARTPHQRRDGIIPAYAGSTSARNIAMGSTSDHPRIRGEHDYAKRAPAGLKGSSPHTRGAPSEAAPSCASRADHPRIRGEHSCLLLRECAFVGSSPHTRGAQNTPPGLRALVWIIPAYAGSTSWLSPASTPMRDHPRIRGEHP